MKHILYFLCFILTLQAQAQKDMVEARGGAITVAPVLHGSLVLQWQGKTIYVDPYGGAEKFAAYPAPDLILITDIHGDHMNLETLQGLDLKKAELIAPKAVMEQLDKNLTFKKKHSLANGQENRWRSINIMAMPMYNLPASADARHPKGRGNGYVLTMGDKRIYIAGDTEAIPEMRQLKNIDIAFIPMNLPYTMDTQQAAEGVLEFKPSVVYPYHFRGAEGKLSDVAAFKEQVEQQNPAIEVRLRSWYPEED